MIISEPANMLEAWFRAKTGIKHRLEDCAYLAAINADHTILSVIVFHHQEGRDIEMDVAPGFIPRSLLRATQRYVVNQLGCDRVTFKFRADNDKSRDAAARLGGKQEGSLRRFYPDGCTQLVYGILKEDYRLGLSA